MSDTREALKVGSKIKDPDALARELGVVVAMVYRSPNYKSSRWGISTRTPGGGGGSGQDRQSKAAATLYASQAVNCGVVLEAGPQRKDSFGYPDWPTYWTVVAIRNGVAA